MTIIKHTSNTAFAMRTESPPEWFEIPSRPTAEHVVRNIFHTNTHKPLLLSTVESLDAGDFCLPPWQRGAVWTEGQRIKMLDSIMRNVTLGVITLWSPSNADAPPFESLAGCKVGSYPRVVIDGQQRLTTMVMAARGDLDDWRWNGDEWTTGRGVMTPSMMASRWATTFAGGWVMDATQGRDEAPGYWDTLGLIQSYELSMMTIEGSLDHMLETYERLATCGTPHTVEELEMMRTWRRRSDH